MTDTPASAWKVTGLLQVLFERVCLAPVSSRGARRWLPLAEGTVGVVAGLVALL
jgi:hypothetical protein